MTREGVAESMVSVEASKRIRRGRWPIVLAVLTVPVMLAVLAAVFAAVFIVPQMSVRAVNDAAAHDIETRLLVVPLPDGADRIDSMSLAGKLSGNGNGMQYLGALLIRSDQTASELQAFYDTQTGMDELSVTVTTAGGLSELQSTPGFLGEPGEPGTFIVYAWGDGPGGDFEDSDLRGH